MVWRFLSWGCGVQSTTLAVMSILGDLDPVDVVISADTGWERQKTYEIRDWYVGWMREHDQAVEIIQGGDIRRQGAEEHVHIPFWTMTGGPLKRQCTRKFKVRPIRRRVREIMGFHSSRPPNPPPGSAELWLGISWDEWARMKSSDVEFIANRWPLIERKMTRWDCVRYLDEKGLAVPVSSSCVVCPYRSASSWLEMQHDGTNDFLDAIEFDEANRDNPLAKRGCLDSDHLFIYQYGGALKEARLEEDAARERPVKRLPLLICEEGHCMV